MTKITDASRPLDSAIAKRLIFYTILCSTAITIVTTAVQLYLDYKRDLSLIDVRTQEIKNIHLSTIAEALWTTDKINLDILLNGIIRMQDTQFAKVTEKGKVIAQAGSSSDDNLILNVFDLTHLHRDTMVTIGQLEVAFTLTGIYERLWKKFWVILISNGIKTFIVAGFMFFIFQVLVTRHLHSLAEKSRHIDTDTLEEPLRLDREFTEGQHEEDELDVLVNSLNEMKQKIAANLRELEGHRDLLEAKVRERTAELEISNRELEAFSYSISHDLRSPLRAINGFSQILQRECDDVLDETSRNYLARIIRASNHMGALIDSLLRLSQINRREMHISRTDLSIICHKIIERFREHQSLNGAEIRIRDNLDSDCDEGLMSIALENLLSNAIKYSQFSKPPIIEIGKTVHKNEEIYYIRDNGSGFNMEYASKLFVPFQRLHNDNEFPGIGVGLATVQRIIERHEGKIWAESIPGKGATFYFTLFN